MRQTDLKMEIKQQWGKKENQVVVGPILNQCVDANQNNANCSIINYSLGQSSIGFSGEGKLGGCVLA